MLSLLSQETFEDRSSVLRFFKVSLILGTLTGLCLWRSVEGGVNAEGGMGTPYLPLLAYLGAATIGALIVGCYKAISLSRRLRHSSNRSTNP